MRTIVFVFAGRRPNMQLQLPLMRRVLADNPDVEYHVWDLTTNDEDHRYVQSIGGERITVISDLHGGKPWKQFNTIYRHYTATRFRDCRFVKLDDDIVFLEARRFGEFVTEIRPGRVLSALVVNNGACTRQVGLWYQFERLGIPLLDVHRSVEYADLSHRHMFDNWHTLIGWPASTVPTTDWLSINMIGYDWDTGRRIAALLGAPSPTHIAGRDFTPQSKIGDEGRVNMLPRLIHTGFLAAHLTFGPQDKQATTEQVDAWRARYRQIGEEYLT